MKAVTGRIALVVALAAALAFGQAVETLMATGMELLRNGAYSQAIATFRKVLSQDPSQFEAQHNIAFAYLQMGRDADAVREFKRAIEMNGRNAETWANLAFAYERMGKGSQATDALNRSVELDPSNITARMNLATMYVNEGKLPQAIAQFKTVIARDSRNVEAYNNLAKCLINSGKHDEAVNYLREALGVEPGNAEAHWELGNILLNTKKDPEKALAEYKIAVSLQSDQIKYHQSVADALEKMGNKQEAADALSAALVYVTDALVREKVQRRIDVLEGRSSGPASSEAAANTPARVEMQDLRRDDDRRGYQSTVTKTQTVDISSDFKDLEKSDGKELDLTKEAKKRASKK